MALLKCEDCGREVSSRAVACPHCGCPVPADLPQEGEGQPVASTVGAKPIGAAPPIPAAWAAKPEEPAAVKVETPAGNATSIRIVKWGVGLLVFLFIYRACSGSGSGGDETVPSITPPAASAPSTPTNAGPTEADKKEWAEDMVSSSVATSVRVDSAKKLIAAFPQSPEGQKAGELLPQLEAELADEAIGRQWSYRSEDEGLGSGSVRHATVQSSNTVSLDFPYAGTQHATLQLRRHPRWGNDVIFSIERGQVLCHSYGDCSVQVRFDDSKILRFQGSEPADNSTEYVFIPAFSTFMKRLPAAKVVKVEVSIYQAGNHVFEFDVSGFKPEKFK